MFFFTAATAALVADLDDIHSVADDLSYYVRNGMVEYVGEDVYAFKIFSMIPFNAQELLAHVLRPGKINYLSFEHMLNEYGVISQKPTLLTVATTGESGLYESDSYRIEFNHVEHSYTTIMENCIFSKSREILEASPLFAVQDLIGIQRNTHLIQEEEIEAAVSFYGDRQKAQKE